MKTVNFLKNSLRPLKNIIYAGAGYIYDFYRFVRYSACTGYINDLQKTDFKAVKIYHRIEKSLSFRNRKRTSGISAHSDLQSFLVKQENSKQETTYHVNIAKNVSKQFAEISRQDFSHEISEFKSDENKGGVLEVTSNSLNSGKLDDPEAFFLSRYSVRDFSKEQVPVDIVRRALKLAMKTPSVCNRHSWYVYHITSRELIDEYLQHQNGNKGFGHEIPSLLIIATDLKAFDTSSERYQHWIDGGMFAMSVVYAFHSLGLSSCCLNWSKNPGDDLKFKKKYSIKDSHSIITMMAVGNANEKIKVCASERAPLDTIYELRN